MGVRRERWVISQFYFKINLQLQDQGWYEVKFKQTKNYWGSLKRNNHRQLLFFFLKYIYPMDLGNLKNKNVEFVAPHKVLLDINRG